MKELIKIQSELKAPKNQRNNFGKYNYRSCEDILEAVKPLMHENNCVLTISDDIIMVGDRIYVQATAKIINLEGHEEYSTALAREPLSQKGMSEPQITGSASSYARKYALNGLFAIDDTKDDDTKEPPKQVKQKLTEERFNKAIEMLEDGKAKESDFDKYDLTELQANALKIVLKDMESYKNK